MAQVELSPSQTHLVIERKLGPLKEVLNQAFVEQLPRINEALEQLAEANKKMASGQAKVTAADRKIAESDRKIAESDRKIAEGNKGIQDVLAKKFFKIFNPTAALPSAEEVNALFAKYLSDNSITAMEEAPFAKINSTRCIIRYLGDHPATKICDLRAFKGQVFDLPALATYLNTSTVKLIALNSSVPAEGKERLAEAVAARSGLKVQYSA